MVGKMRSALTAFVVLFVSLLIGLAFDHFGHGHMLAIATDRGGDFVKVVLALPGPPVAHDPFGFDPLIRKYTASPDFAAFGGVNYLPPLSMFISCMARLSIALVSPIIVYLALWATMLIAIMLATLRYGGNVVWPLAVAVSYPLVFMVDRGNLYAGVAGLCIILAMVRRKPDLVAAILFAVALNIRPNAALCALPLALADWRFAVRTTAAAASIFAASLAATHILDPAYGIAAFTDGLNRYFAVMVEQGHGVAFGSSAYGALFAVGGAGFLRPVTVLLVALIPAAMFLRWRRRLDDGQFAFACCALTALITPIFGDYHLLIFVAPLIMARDRVTFAGSLLMLVPKSIAMVGGYSVQVLLNPVIMLVTLVIILGRPLLPISPAVARKSPARTTPTPVRSSPT